MNKDLEQQFSNRWPKWFNFKGSIQHTLIPFGFECGDGWFQLIWKLCEDLEPMVKALDEELLKEHPGGEHYFEVLQVKEKFGGLRFYTSTGSNEIFDRINQAERESEETCEVCGKPGKLHHRHGWLTTVCDGCKVEGQEPVKEIA